MELIQIYAMDKGLEVLFFMIALVSAIAFVCGVVATVTEERSKKRRLINIGITSALLILFIFSVIFCVKTDPYTVYTYRVTDATEVGNAIDNGWSIYDKDGELYDLIKK